MSDELIEVPSKIGLSKEQKIGFTLLLVFALMSVSLGILKIRNTLYAPFALNNKVPANLKDEVNSVDALRFRDTDNDDLTDFDELYVHGTSPYLFDTFAYGMSDKEVIAKGLPLCPKGQDCGTGSGEELPVFAASSSLYIQEPILGDIPLDLNAALSDPKQLRQMLIGAGMDDSILKKISDADLVLMVRQIMSTNSSTINSIQSINDIIKNPPSQ